MLKAVCVCFFSALVAFSHRRGVECRRFSCVALEGDLEGAFLRIRAVVSSENTGHSGEVASFPPTLSFFGP